MFSIEESVQCIKMENGSEGMVITAQPRHWQLIGRGRSAFVFKIKNENKAVKVFYPEFTALAKEEAEIYRCLEGLPAFPSMYEHGDSYIVMDYIHGKTLYQCLVDGTVVTAEIIAEIDAALDSARRRGLNPSDIHLRNIILTPSGKIKLIDVVRFRQEKRCNQWNDLKKAYYKYYQKRYFPKRISPRVLEFVAKSYRRDLIPTFKHHALARESESKTG